MRGKDGEYLVKSKRVTGFTNAEEVVGLSNVVPFLLEDRLKERGGVYSKGADWGPYVRGRQACDRSEPVLLGTRSTRVAEAASLSLD